VTVRLARELPSGQEIPL